jgi:hypothetical protein
LIRRRGAQLSPVNVWCLKWLFAGGTVTYPLFYWLHNKVSSLSEHSFGICSIRGQVLRSSHGLLRALEAFSSGLKYGYPVCCVLNYALDALLGIPSGITRGEKVDLKSGTYVPCHYHRRVTQSISRSACSQLLDSGFAVEHLAPEDQIETRINGKIVSAVRIPAGSDAIFLSQIRLSESS